MSEFKLDGVEYFSQRDNKYIDPNSKTNVASISCFPTSLAMCMNYALKKIGLDKTAVGCASENQLEDYINRIIDDYETKQWMIKNQGRLGSWIWKYKRRTLYAIEEYIFNRLMNQHGYKAEAKYNFTYETVCNVLKQTELPMVIGGNFSSVSKVQGHMNCCIGYNSIGLKEFIVHDPYGNALKGYSQETIGKGNDLRYPVKFFQKEKGYIYCVVISKI